MTLYEIVTTWCGESYVRSYAWAESEAEARRMFVEAAPEKYSGSIRTVEPLFSHDAAPFVTTPSDCGWEK